MTPSPKQKKQSRPTPLPPRSLTSRFRAHAPQQCALSRRSRVTQVASEYPAMLRRSNLVSGGSVASARPLGTVRTLYPDMIGMSRGSAKMPPPTGSEAATPVARDTNEEERAAHAAGTFVPESTAVDP